MSEHTVQAAYSGAGKPDLNGTSLEGKIVLITGAARAIGRLKRNTNMPIYEPDREKIIFDNVRQLNRGPLEHQDLIRVYERLIDVMRKIQKEEIVPKGTAGSGDTELESEVND